MTRTMMVVMSLIGWGGGAAVGEALPVIVPAPQEITWTTGGPAWIDVVAINGVTFPEEAQGVQAGLERLRASLGAPLPETAAGNLRLTLCTLDGVFGKTRAEAYIVTVRGDGIAVAAETPHGLHNGLVSLTRLVTPEKRIPCVTIRDWPDLAMRGTYAPNIEEAEAHFDEFAALKLNLLLLEDARLYDLDKPEIRERFQKLAERCRANFIEFVPELQSLGWGHSVLQREPRCVEARWVSQRPFPIKDGRVFSPDPELPPPPSVQNPLFEDGLKGWTSQTHRSGAWHPSTETEAYTTSAPGRNGYALALACEEHSVVRAEQTLDTAPDARYELRCQVKTEQVAGEGAIVEVYGVEEDGALGAFLGVDSNPQRGDTDWTQHRVVFETGARDHAQPGGGHDPNAVAKPYHRVRVYPRLQEASGRAYFSELEIVPLPSPNPLGNVVVTEAAKVLVQSADGTQTYEAGRDYALDVPPLHYPFEEGPAMNVIVSPGGRIQEGDTVLLSYNQAQREDVTCCPSEPLYRDFLRNAIRGVVDAFHPKYLHIGHDEPRFFNRDQRCADRAMNNETLFADDIIRTRDFAKEADPNLRVMLWDDAINPFQNGPNLGTSDAAKALPRDLIINVWWYDNFGWPKQIDESLGYFLNLGFEVTGSPWFRIPTAWHWAEIFNQHKEDARALGIIYTSWPTETPWAALEFTAEQAWSFGKPAYNVKS